MKIECNVIKDLLPLYLDDCCSDESKYLVNEHLAECEICKDSYNHMKVSINDESIDISTNSEKHDEIVIKNGIKRLRRIWLLSIALVLILAILSLLTINEVKGEGRCFTNIYDIYKCKQFLNAVENQKFEKAFKYLDIKSTYKDESHLFPDKTDINQYRKIAKTYFVQDNQLLVKSGFKLTKSEFSTAYKADYGWCIELRIFAKNESGIKVYIGKLQFVCNQNGIFPLTCLAKDSNMNESSDINNFMGAINDWHAEAYDNLTGSNQFEPIKENEAWRK